MSHNILYFEYFSPKGTFQNCENGNFFEKNHFYPFFKPRRWSRRIKNQRKRYATMYVEKLFFLKKYFQNCENVQFFKAISPSVFNIFSIGWKFWFRNFMEINALQHHFCEKKILVCQNFEFLKKVRFSKNQIWLSKIFLKSKKKSFWIFYFFIL